MRYFIYEVILLSWFGRLRYAFSLSLTVCLLSACASAYTPRFVEERDVEASCVLVDVQPLSQYPDFPTGCESVTAVMALRHAGVSVSTDDFVEEHLLCDNGFYEKNGLLYGPDPYAVFIGDPRCAESYGCMAPVMEQALLSCVGGEKTVTNTTGEELSALCRNYLDNGVPVMLWATMEMRPVSSGKTWFLPDGRQFVWPAGEHCLLLVGYSETEYWFNDPRHGATVAYDKNAVEVAYASLGKQSLIVQ